MKAISDVTNIPMLNTPGSPSVCVVPLDWLRSSDKAHQVMTRLTRSRIHIQTDVHPPKPRLNKPQVDAIATALPNRAFVPPDTTQYIGHGVGMTPDVDAQLSTMTHARNARQDMLI